MEFDPKVEGKRISSHFGIFLANIASETTGHHLGAILSTTFWYLEWLQRKMDSKMSSISN